MLGEVSTVEEVEVCGRDGPNAGGGEDEGVGSGVIDIRAEVSGVGKVAGTCGVPDDGAALGIVVRQAGDPPGTAGVTCGR